MKDVVLNEKNIRRTFYGFLEKICEDFNVNDSKRIIEDFIKRQK